MMTISRRSLLLGALMSAVMLSACGKKEEAAAPAPAAAPVAQVKEYVVGTDAAYAPFEFENEKKQVEGFDIDVLSAVAEGTADIGICTLGNIRSSEGQQATERELQQFVAGRAADYKVPKKILFMDEIPKGATGKLQRIGLAAKLGLGVVYHPSPLDARVIGGLVGKYAVTFLLATPTFLTAPPGDSRLFILERPGRIRVMQNGSLLATPFLDISSLTTVTGERGLLSMAFHPLYASNGYFFLYYTNRDGDIAIERRQVSAGNANVADPLSALTILTIPHPTFNNHNGGLLSFGPDGYLYAGTGDGDRKSVV